MKVLLLGGTAEGRRIASALAGRRDVTVVSSLAGRVAGLRMPVGAVRVGGFGGAAGLADWLRAERVDVVVDVTHPFAARMTAHAAEACREVDVPLLVHRRPGWTPAAGDDWRWVDSLGAAAELLPELGERVFLTTGRQGLSAFAGLDELWFLVRCIDPPSPPLPARLEVVLDRGPFTVEGERDLIRRHGIDVLVTKDSGGPMTGAKLVAAREVGVPVVVVRRPALPAGIDVVPTVEGVLERLEDLIR